MPSLARSRPLRASGGQFANREEDASSLVAKPETAHNNVTNTHNSAHHAPHAANGLVDHSLDVGGELPPAKRRKLAFRDHRQTTLENFVSAGPKPPVKLLRTEPHGQLVEAINGVQNVLDIKEDELSLPPSGARTPTKPSAHVSNQRVAPAPKQEDKRTLRSQDEGPKLKSDLAIYFPNYDEIIFDTPKEPEFISVDSAIYVSDDAPKQASAAASPVKSPKTVKSSPAGARAGSSHAMPPPNTPQKSWSNQFNGSPSLNLDFMARTLPDVPEDPLSDDFYLKSHRREERKERSSRNREKEHAMHEKVQLDRLLDGLLGHDWLRVMGITAIGDSEAKKFEPKRDYFIAEVQALVDKFKQWKEQEKRLKVQKEAVVAAREATEDQDSDEGSVGPPSSDLNASAAQQLQRETASAIKHAAAARANKPKDSASAPSTPKPPPVYVPPPPDIPITSFYEKRHLRDAALGKSRHGRTVTAFGLPVPEPPEEEFQLPEDYLTEDVIRANARERRRRKRASAVDSTSG